MSLMFKPKVINISNQLISFSGIKDVENEFSSTLYKHIKDIVELDSKKSHSLMIKKDEQIKNLEGYKIVVDEKQVLIYAASENGAYYGLLTLKDLINNNITKSLEIIDEPALKIRGAMLDISRSKVLLLSTLKDIVKKLSVLRYNHLQLYVEGFSFEYKSFKKYLTDNNYISLDDYIELDKFSKEYYIDFVPNQNGFGHMSDWLSLDEYKNLAESPDGFYIWGCMRKPSTLNPLDPRSITLVKKMYEDMLPYTSSKYFNMNFDEPYELGFGLSKEALNETTTKEDLYINYFNKLSSFVQSLNKTPMLFGDVLIKHPDKLKDLNQNAIFIDWGYNKDYNFNQHAKMLQEKNVKYLLAPGTSSWGSITSRYIDMKQSIKHSANAAKKYSGLGILVTDWGDMGHLQYPISSYLGFIYGGLISWYDASMYDAKMVLKKYLNNDALYEATLELSNYHLLECGYRDYGSVLFTPIMWAEHARNQQNSEEFFIEKMKYNLIDDKNIELLKISFNKAKMLLDISYECLEKDELTNSLNLLQTLLKINNKFKICFNQSYDDEISELKMYLKTHKTLWEKRNNPNGYKLSSNRIYWLIDMLSRLDRKENI